MNRMQAIAAALGIETLTQNKLGVDAFMPFLELMKNNGAVVVVKLDGQRRAPEDTDPYTVIVTSSAIPGGFIRKDAQTIEEALSYVVDRYATDIWRI